jgi:hypothetical protein
MKNTSRKASRFVIDQVRVAGVCRHQAAVRGSVAGCRQWKEKTVGGRDRDWCAIKGQKAKQSYAIAMKDGAPFGVAGAGPFPCRWPVLIFVVARFEPDLLSAWM